MNSGLNTCTAYVHSKMHPLGILESALHPSLRGLCNLKQTVLDGVIVVKTVSLWEQDLPNTYGMSLYLGCS